jgi:hypothetical protein
VVSAARAAFLPESASFPAGASFFQSESGDGASRRDRHPAVAWVCGDCVMPDGRRQCHPRHRIAATRKLWPAEDKIELPFLPADGARFCR